MSVKGLQLPGYDPRGVLGQALGYATSNRGGCHLRAYMVAPEILGKPKLVDRLTFSGKSGLVMIHQNFGAVIDSLVMCKFASFAISEEECADILSAVTGIEYSSEDLLKTGERIWNMERLYNLREGFTREDDTLPDRMFQGDNAINRSDFNATLKEYYRFRGWNEYGIPTEDALSGLGLLGDENERVF